MDPTDSPPLYTPSRSSSHSNLRNALPSSPSLSDLRSALPSRLPSPAPSPTLSPLHDPTGTIHFSSSRRRSSARVPIELDACICQDPILLFPASETINPDVPGSLPAGEPGPSSAASRDTTVVQGEVIAKLAHRTRVGPLRIVWEVAVTRRKDGRWRPREVIETIALDTADEDRWLDAGKHKFYFQLSLPATLPPSSSTAFERVTHTLFVSILEPVPDYSTPSSPCPSPKLRPADGGRDRHDEPERENHWIQSFTPDASRRGSLAALTPLPPPRGAIPHDTLAEGSRRGSLLKSIFGRRTSDDPRQESGKPAPDFGPDGTKGSGRDFGEGDGQDNRPNQAEEDEELADSPLPAACQECLASVTQVRQAVSSHDQRGELRRVQWFRESDPAGMGHLQTFVLSDLFVLGAGFNLCLILTFIPPLTTIHAIGATLLQQTTSPDGSATDHDSFSLYRRGKSYNLNEALPPREGDYIWRGETARSIDAQAQTTKSGRRRPTPLPAAPTPQASVPNIKAHSDDLRLSVKPRLPSPVIGGLPTSPTYLPKGISRTEHTLRLEIFYSVLGEDGAGRAMPAVGARPPEGQMRRFWVDRAVSVGSCVVSPTNILAPAYSPFPPELDLDPLQPVAKGAEPTSFTIPRKASREVRAEAGVREEARKLPPLQEARNGLRRHQLDTEGTCVCFLQGDNLDFVVGEMEKNASGPNWAVLPAEMFGAASKRDREASSH